MTLVQFSPVSLSILSGAVDSMIEKIFLSNPADSAATLLSQPITSYGDLNTVLSSLYNNVFMPVALCLVVIYFLVGMIDKSMTFDDMSIPQVWRQCVLLIGCLLLLTHGYDIMTTLLDIGSGLFSNMQGFINVDAEGLNLTVEEVREGLGIEDSLGGDLGGLISLLIPWLLSSLFPIIIKAICYMRLLEIAVRICMMPLSLSDFFQNGLHGAGWRNLKAFLAVALQTVSIYLILYVSQAILGTVGTNVDDSFIIVYLAIWAATIGLLFRSQSLCKEIIGA